MPSGCSSYQQAKRPQKEIQKTFILWSVQIFLNTESYKQTKSNVQKNTPYVKFTIYIHTYTMACKKTPEILSMNEVFSINFAIGRQIFKILHKWC